jgi:hypothetical protein
MPETIDAEYFAAVGRLMFSVHTRSVTGRLDIGRLRLATAG